MENESLNSSKKYWLQQGCNKVQARVANVENKVNIDQLALESATQLGLNDIGTISIQTAETIIGISYQENQQMGAFILINPVTNNTAGLGFIK
jgi:sulfate adenylyltransferase subunit 1